ncbi:hypothetical protein ACSTJO_00425, partial [Vibrio parahaemolyticus]
GRRTPGFGPSDRGWFIGGGIALIWTFPTLLSLWELPDLWASIAGTIVEIVFAAVFLVSVPVIRRTPQRFARLLPAGILFGLSLL